MTLPDDINGLTVGQLAEALDAVATIQRKLTKRLADLAAQSQGTGMMSLREAAAELRRSTDYVGRMKDDWDAAVYAESGQHLYYQRKKGGDVTFIVAGLRTLQRLMAEHRLR